MKIGEQNKILEVETNMSLPITCLGCGKELDEPGALLFTPPTEPHQVLKIHLCADMCYPKVKDLILSMRPIEQLIEQSSLGTPGAKAIRARTPKHVTDEIMRRAGYLECKINED